jgi:hypothetical protein
MRGSATVQSQADEHHAIRGQAVGAASTLAGKSHATFRRAIGLLHPAGSSSAGRAPLWFNDEHFCRREQRPAKRGNQGSATRSTEPRRAYAQIDYEGSSPRTHYPVNPSARTDPRSPLLASAMSPKEEPVLAGLELMPAAPLDEARKPRP